MTPDQAVNYLSRVEEALRSIAIQQGLKKFAAVAAGELGRAMVKGQSPDGTPYAPLKRPRGRGHNQRSGPLIDFGDLMLSLIGDSADHVELYEPRKLRFGTKDRRAKWHQYGTSKMPARKFVGYTPDMRVAAKEIVTEAVMNQVAGVR